MKWPISLMAVAQAVITSEAHRLFERVAATIAAGKTQEDRVVAAFTSLALGLRNHALFHRLVRLEPDETLPKVTTDASGMLAMGIHWSVDVLCPPDADERTRADLAARVEIVARFLHSAALTKHAVMNMDSEKKLTEFARTYIAPIITGGSAR